MQPQNINTTSGEDADKHLARVGNWVVANVRQQIGWPEKNTLVHFREHTLALIPEESQQYPAVAFLKSESMDNNEAQTIILHFLSSLAWAEGRAISVEAWSGGGCPYRLSRTRLGQMRRPKFQINYLPDPQEPKARLALALYREGITLEHDAYAFLSLYKIINLIRPRGSDQIEWIAHHLGEVSATAATERIDTLTAAGEDVSTYLYVSGRCAVAHAGVDPTVDPENLEDARRLHDDFPLIKNLAEIAIEEEFYIQTPQRIWLEHKYELGGFVQVLGADFVMKMKARGTEFRRRVPAIPNLTVRLFDHTSYQPLVDMNPTPRKATDGVVVFDCRSVSRRVSLFLTLDFPNERLHFDPVNGISVHDDGTPEAAEEAAELQRFLGDYFGNGQLEVWAGSGNLLSRCRPFIPNNIDLTKTMNNFLEAEKKCVEIAARRKSNSQ